MIISEYATPPKSRSRIALFVYSAHSTKYLMPYSILFQASLEHLRSYFAAVEKFHVAYHTTNVSHISDGNFCCLEVQDVYCPEKSENVFICLNTT